MANSYISNQFTGSINFHIIFKRGIRAYIDPSTNNNIIANDYIFIKSNIWIYICI